jgi:hypothetical protein
VITALAIILAACLILVVTWFLTAPYEEDR